MRGAIGRVVGSLLCWLIGSHLPQPYSLRLVCRRCGRTWHNGEDYD